MYRIVIIFRQDVDERIEINFVRRFRILSFLLRRVSAKTIHGGVSVCPKRVWDGRGGGGKEEIPGNGGRGGGKSKGYNILPWENVRRARKTSLLGGGMSLIPSVSKTASI